MLRLPDDIGFLLSAPRAGPVVPCSGRKTTFLPLFDPKFKWFFFKERFFVFLSQSDNNKWKERTTRAATTTKKQVLASSFFPGLGTHHPLSARLQKCSKPGGKSSGPGRVLSRLTAKRRGVRRGSGSVFLSLIWSWKTGTIFWPSPRLDFTLPGEKLRFGCQW